jgi:hypothetical protein
MFVHWFWNFCNISCVKHIPDDGHKSGRNMYMDETYCVCISIKDLLNVCRHLLVSS